jgi:hypothetical protein
MFSCAAAELENVSQSSISFKSPGENELEIVRQCVEPVGSSKNPLCGFCDGTDKVAVDTGGH